MRGRATPSPLFARSLTIAAGVTLLVAAAPVVALAQPVSFQLKNDVPDGKKPTLEVRAVERVLNLHLDLERDDGTHVSTVRPALARGEAASLPIGDGKPGRAHWRGTLACDVPGGPSRGGGPWSYDLEFDTLVRAPLVVTYDYEHLDLAHHVIRFQLSRPAGKAEVVVTGEDGRPIGTGDATYRGEPAGTWLALPWQQDPGNVMMLHLKVTSAEGLAREVELIPWSVAIAHEDVNFATGSAEIAPAEAGKLDASLAKIRDAARRVDGFVKVRLYVAGHTDTVGSKEHNRKLSLDRARAIAEYFRKKGLTLPIAYEGFGEEALAVQTPDETDEPKNRRADYVLGAAGAPTPGASLRKAAGDWKSVP